IWRTFRPISTETVGGLGRRLRVTSFVHGRLCWLTSLVGWSSVTNMISRQRKWKTRSPACTLSAVPQTRPLMPARSIASATISFGLVSVPVNLYSSSESKTSVSFNMLHKKCNSRLKQQYTCPKDNEIVTREETVKGYEFAKDQYVVFTPEELKALEEKATGMIEVVEFVPLAKVDREY